MNTAPYQSRDCRISTKVESYNCGKVVDKFQLWSETVERGETGPLSRKEGFEILSFVE